MTLPIVFGPVGNTVAVIATGPQTRLSCEMPLPMARALLANLTLAVAEAEAWRVG